LDGAISTATGLLEEIDTALKLGRAAVTRFQRFAVQGSSDLLILQAMLQEASACLAAYQRARKQAHVQLDMISWYLDQEKQVPIAA